MKISYEEYINDYAYACASKIVKYAEWELNNILEKKFYLKHDVRIPDYFETQAFKDSFEFFSEDVGGSDIAGFIEDFLEESYEVKWYHVDYSKCEVFIDFYDDADEEEFAGQLKEKLERMCQDFEPSCDAFCEEEYCGQLKESLEIILADEKEFNKVAGWDCWKQISEDADELKALMAELIEELKEKI